MKFMVNSQKYDLNIDKSMRLIDLLRNELNLTGTKEGCSEGECGACTIIVDNQAVTSCIMLAGSIENKAVITIEGLAKNNELDKIQQALIDNGAVQCGFCTPGMIMSIKALYLKNANPDINQIKKALSGNLCRCTGYDNIVKAAASLKEVHDEIL